MPYKPTGKPPGRPRGAVATKPRKLRAVPATGRREDLGLTAEQIAAATPADAFRALLQHALRIGDLDLARSVARDWAPYVHPRVPMAVEITPEMLRAFAELARAEAKRRGYDLTKDAAAPPANAKPN